MRLQQAVLHAAAEAADRSSNGSSQVTRGISRPWHGSRLRTRARGMGHPSGAHSCARAWMTTRGAMPRSQGERRAGRRPRQMEHVSVKPNERRKKLSLLQMQREKVIKCMQIWQGSQKYKEVPFVLILFPSVLIIFPFARCHVCWCMQTCNVYMDSTIIFYFLFCRDSSIT